MDAPLASPVRAPARVRRARGFSLVEIALATAVLGLVTAGVLRVFVQVLTIYHYDNGKALVNRDLRKLTAEFTENAVYASEFRVYETTSHFSRVNATPTNGVYASDILGSPVAATGLGPTAVGDCLVLVFRDRADEQRIARVVVYFKNGTNVPLRRYNRTFTPSTAEAVEKLIPTIGTAEASIPQVIERVQGNNVSTRLFAQLSTRSVLVNAQAMRRGVVTQPGKAWVAGRYRIVISPRG